MRGIRVLAVAASLLAQASDAADAQRRSFDPSPYTSADGALTTLVHGTIVEPYFAVKALLEAHHGGLDISASGTRWVEWLRGRQRPDGRFERYCREAFNAWRACGAADSDAALLGLWIQLLATLPPPPGHAAAWRVSARAASGHMASLLDPILGVYRIATNHRTALLMDNTEILAALRAAARSSTPVLLEVDRREHRDAAGRLAPAIIRVYEQPPGQFRSSTQLLPQVAFYPDVVGQVYPLRAGLYGQRVSRVRFAKWLDAHLATWLGGSGDEYPWGLIALASLHLGWVDVARCWAARSAPLRYGPRWNLLEDSALQVIVAATGPAGSGAPIPCTGAGLPTGAPVLPSSTPTATPSREAP